jgi:hypothetical protein
MRLRALLSTLATLATLATLTTPATLASLFLATTPAFAAGSGEYALIVVFADEPGGTVVEDIQMPAALVQDCARDADVAGLCEEIRSLEGASAAEAVSELHRWSWALEKTISGSLDAIGDAAGCSMTGGVSVWGADDLRPSVVDTTASELDGRLDSILYHVSGGAKTTATGVAGRGMSMEMLRRSGTGTSRDAKALAQESFGRQVQPSRTRTGDSIGTYDIVVGYYDENDGLQSCVDLVQQRLDDGLDVVNWILNEEFNPSDAITTGFIYSLR